MKTRCLSCFKTVSIPSRFRIFEYIKKQKGKINIAALTKYIALRQPTVTFHVNALVRAGLLVKHKTGRSVYCHLPKKCPDCILFK